MSEEINQLLSGRVERHGRSVSGDSAVASRMRTVPENADGDANPATPSTSSRNEKTMRVTRAYSLNEQKLRCMRVRQTSFEAPLEDLPTVGKVRTRRWSTSQKVPMGEYGED